jgi:hypothetical protein
MMGAVQETDLTLQREPARLWLEPGAIGRGTADDKMRTSAAA